MLLVKAHPKALESQAQLECVECNTIVAGVVGQDGCLLATVLFFTRESSLSRRGGVW